MKYMGSKARISKDILKIVLRNRSPGQWYVEPFCGGCNTIDKVRGRRIANDIHSPLIAMWIALTQDKWIPDKITRERYREIRDNKNNYSPAILGWVGFNCSYGGRYFEGFAGKTKTKIGVRDYQNEARNNVLKQVPNLHGVVFQNKNYLDLQIPPNSIVYCDPPYVGTKRYSSIDTLNMEIFWNWCRKTALSGHEVYISGYSSPEDFETIWSKEVKSSLSSNGKIGGSKSSMEKLFRYSQDQY